VAKGPIYWTYFTMKINFEQFAVLKAANGQECPLVIFNPHTIFFLLNIFYFKLAGKLSENTEKSCKKQ